MTSQEIRQKFLDFFEQKSHKIVSSAPVVPYDDPTLLFTNAGMNQFKDVFLGKGSRDYKRAADTQKCIRVSGKHNDLEEVGHDTYHHTFFEMLGNWSFGDYYKEEAIVWAWDLLTGVFGLPKDRLWATVYRTDEEALELWKTKTDINPNHILKFDEKDNFWEMGETGPCGPCSEIHINLCDDFENPKWVNAGTEECKEIWNLVFIQYNRDENGILHELPAKHVDTGMGFERLCAVLQNKNSNYETDVFQPVISKISEISNKNYSGENLAPMNVIADHIRTLTFAIADGAVPGNEGRGYVLRRILRRAARYGRKLDLKNPFIYTLVDVLVKTMGDVFPEIKTNQKNIEKIIRAEEESFNATLDRGIELFENLAVKAEKNDKIISGADVFKLYDTFGFPVDLTNVMAQERGLKIDEDMFIKLMDEQKERARKSTKDKVGIVTINTDNLDDFEFSDKSGSEFIGYQALRTTAKITGLKKDEKHYYIILDKTPFYFESGGQSSDKAKIVFKGKETDVLNVIKIEDELIHIVESEMLSLNLNDEVDIEIDSHYRWAIMRNHSATHLLHKALRDELGTHVKQSGSYVGADRLRFDFTHFEKVSTESLERIEAAVNKKIRENLELNHHRSIDFDKAKDMGALMFFGEKYGDIVNVVQFGDYSMEFCGGTHVNNSAQIGLFKILSESSISSGIRRIEAVTGEGVEEYIKVQKLNSKKLEEKIEELLEEKKKLEKKLAESQLKSKLDVIGEILEAATEINGIKIAKAKVDASSMDELKNMADELRLKIKSGIGLLISEIEGKAGIVCVVTDDLTKKNINAGKIVGEIAKILGGGGGGRPHMATAGGKDLEKISEALANFEKICGNNQ